MRPSALFKCTYRVEKCLRQPALYPGDYPTRIQIDRPINQSSTAKSTPKTDESDFGWGSLAECSDSAVQNGITAGRNLGVPGRKEFAAVPLEMRARRAGFRKIR